MRGGLQLACTGERQMESNDHALAEMFRQDAISGFEKYTPRLVRCLQLMSENEIWWRPNKASNAAGSIVLHLCGNIRQWIISGLGEIPGARIREKEFSERGPIKRRMLIGLLRNTVGEASGVIGRLPCESLLRMFRIQGYQVSGLVAILHVYEHFAYHTGQIIYLTKLKLGKDLRFTHLPVEKSLAKRNRAIHP
jgi:hypothetical protein